MRLTESAHFCNIDGGTWEQWFYPKCQLLRLRQYDVIPEGRKLHWLLIN